MAIYDQFGNEIPIYDESGNELTLEISDNSAVLEALTAQNESLQTIIEAQATTNAHLEETIAIQQEMLYYVAYIFVVVLVIALYRILSSALNAMFGGG